MSRLDELAKDVSSIIDKPAGNWSPDKMALDPEHKEPVKEQTDAPNAFTEVSILQLYVFLWKMAFASLLFSLPFFLVYLLVSGHL